ncbi:MAG TPA: P-type conjugative transfer protein TrbJ [Hyphomonadaceae bacterium]|nr:P-type conjugative transfer protein TrbJ [Hyphomonadaceae bacterium]
MSARLLRVIGAGVAALALVLAPAPRAHAITVFDPTNLAQNLLQATRALEQINNQIRQIEQAAAMLRTNPLQLSPELSQSIGEARRLFSAAQGLAFQVDQLSDDLRTRYPETWEEFDLEEIVGQSDRWMAESRAALERAMQAEARAAASIERSQGAIDRALQSSGASEGQTGAIQAGNQLLGIQASQLAEIHALLIAQGRALETEHLERIAREERAREIQRRAFPTERSGTLTPARTAF